MGQPRDRNVANERTLKERLRSARTLATTGLSIALWTAAAHLTLVALIRAFKSEMYWYWAGRDVVWIVPAGYLVIFVTPVVALSLLHALFPRVVRRHWVLGFVAALGVFSVLLLYTHAHSWALAILAAAVGVRLAPLLRDQSSTAALFIRRVGLALAALFAILGVGSELRRDLSEGRALATLGATSPAAPNVLLLILDTVRASSMSVYGSARNTTPRLAAWARRGVTFDQAYATTTWTLPSHASMFTGRYGSQHSADWESTLDGTHRTLAEVFHDAGYATGAFAGNLLLNNHETGLGRGFITYQDTKRSLAEVASNTTLSQSSAIRDALRLWQDERWLGGALRELARFDMRPVAWTVMHDDKPGAEIVASFREWQAALGGKPFFAFVNLFDAHVAKIAPRYQYMFGNGATRRDVYDGALRLLDDVVSDLLDDLDRRGVLRNTIVVVTADHGEQFGEHGLAGHGNALYREGLRVPLIVLSSDSTSAGLRIATQVSLRDVAATILDLALGPNGDQLPGRSLAAHWGQISPETSPVLAELSRGIREAPTDPTSKGDMAAVADDTLYIIRNGDGSFEAYAYRVDTTEARNLATGAAVQPIAALFSLLRSRALEDVTARSASAPNER